MLSTTIEGGVRVLDFNRPDKHNAVHTELYDELTAALQAARADPQTRAVVLASRGKSFCAGNDVSEFDTVWPKGEANPVYRYLNALHEMEVPVIAAMHGAAIGIGATMLLHCDVIFAAPAAYLRFPFIDIGIVLEGGSSHLLFQWLGRPRAMEILLSGRKIPAVEAERLGLVSSVVEDTHAAALQFAAEVAAKSPEAVKATKRLARLSTAEVFPKRFAAELAEVSALLETRRAAAKG